MAIKYGVNWRGSRKMKKWLDNLAKSAPERLNSALHDEARVIFDISQSRVPVSQGELRQSGYIEVAGKKITIGYRARHAIFIHEGIRGGFMPPAEAFREWAAIKLGDERMAFPVARAVGERGLEPTKFLEGPMKERLHGMANRVRRKVNAGL